MNPIERMRAAQRRIQTVKAERPSNAQAPAETPAVVSDAAPQAEILEPAPAVPTGSIAVVHLCGHEGTVQVGKCRACHSAADRAARKRQRARHEERERQQLPNRGRLPQGASFQVSFDAAALQWSGELVIPGQGGGPPSTFSGSAGAVFGLLSKLDRRYRASLKGGGPTEPGA